MNELDIVDKYEKHGYTLRHLSEIYNTNHHFIKKILLRNSVIISRRKTLKKQKRRQLLKNMKAHLKYRVSFKWLNSFNNIEKLKYLNHSIHRKRDYKGFDSKIYKSFIEKFYYDKKFNHLFDKWIETGDVYIKPSLDHIKAKSKGGKLNELDNLQFISWLENRAKNNIDQKEWEIIKNNIAQYF